MRSYLKVNCRPNRTAKRGVDCFTWFETTSCELLSWNKRIQSKRCVQGFLYTLKIGRFRTLHRRRRLSNALELHIQCALRQITIEIQCHLAWFFYSRKANLIVAVMSVSVTNVFLCNLTVLGSLLAAGTHNFLCGFAHACHNLVSFLFGLSRFHAIK